MGILRSTFNVNNQSAQENREEMLSLIEQLHKNLEKSRFQGKEHHIAKARKRNKMLARERIELVLGRR